MNGMKPQKSFAHVPTDGANTAGGSSVFGGQAPSHKKWLTGIKENIWAYVFLAPALLLFGIFFVYPFVYSSYLSFMDWNLYNDAKEFVGLANYQALFGDPVFWKAALNTGLYVIGTVPVSMILALGLASLVEKAGKLKEFYRFLLFIPVVASIAVVGIIWSLLYSPAGGFINQMLALIGIQGPNWLNDPKFALVSLMIIGIWSAVGYNMVLYIAGLKGIDPQLYEAAELDGASGWQQFWKITVPQLSPVSFFVFIVSIFNSFQVFSTIHIMTQGGPNNATNVVIYQMYQEAFQFFNIGKASALTFVIFCAVLLLTVVFIRSTQRNVHYE